MLIEHNILVFYQIFNDFITYFVPKIRMKSKYKFPPLFSTELKTNVINKRLAHKKYKQTENAVDYYGFSGLRVLCK